MSFVEAVRSVLVHYATFSGRARRSEFWWFALFTVGVYFVAGILDTAIGITFFSVIALLGLIVPGLAVSVRRLHDTDRSGWWYLISFVPFGGLVMLVFCCLDSTPGENRFGPSPKLPKAVGYGIA